MRLTLAACAAWLAVSAGVASAQTPSFFDHIDVATADLETGRAWYMAHLGGRPDQRADHVWFGKTWFVVLLKTATPKPSAEGPVHHIAFSYPDVDAKVTELVAAGAKVITPARKGRGWFTSALVEAPSGVLIELVEDPAVSGFHHVHMRVADPDAATKWFLRLLGGTRTKVKNASGIQYGEVTMLIEKGAPSVPSAGAGLDHLAFRVEKANYEGLLADMKSLNVGVQKVPQSYKLGPISGTSGYFEGPAVTRLEILERAPNYQPPN